ncbi:MAG: hypothetical protein AAFZ09_06860 [Pseudomonadota bacterium]
MAQSVKLSDEVMAFVRDEARLQDRSVAGQIAHWVRIGRTIERSPGFDYARVREALEAVRAPETLTPEEHDVWLGAFGDALSTPTPEAEAFFDDRRRRGLGVGLSQTGDIVGATESR